MVFDITQLKKIRKHLNLTQSQFAKEAQVSQSMIAKIESNKLDPTYSYIKKIEHALEKLSKHQEKQAKDIMIPRILSAKPHDRVSSLIKLMGKHSISQLPVIERGNVLGLITESSLLSREKEEILHKFAQEIMEPAPPIVSPDASLPIIKQLLLFYSIILIKEKGKLTGLITKADLIKSLV
ncbi:CBS domain-containing protein [Candidatus Pacearchaeota archaeon]|nr:CBS domain-containing protein [Candidatus Pacearchaeota archaeon]